MSADPEELVLPPEPTSVRLARAFVSRRGRALGVDADTCNEAVLLASEVVTNAIIHGRSEARLRVLLGPRGRLRVEVADDNSRHPNRPGQDVDALDGRGLRILDKLAHRWGVRDHRYGKTVWFEVTAAPR
jgi:anti-sigma regulatory factor (Ser/Thr protein kinase)